MNTNMNTSAYTTPATTDTAVSTLISSIIMFIEAYRMSTNYNSKVKLSELYVPMYTNLMLSRYSIPRHTFSKFSLYIESFLQQMIVYDSFSVFFDAYYFNKSTDYIISDYEHTANPWWENLYASVNTASTEYTCFINAIRDQLGEDDFCINTLSFNLCNENVIIAKAYELLDTIVDEYHSSNA